MLGQKLKQTFFYWLDHKIEVQVGQYSWCLQYYNIQGSAGRNACCVTKLTVC